MTCAWRISRVELLGRGAVLGVGATHDACQPVQRLPVGGQGVHLLLVDELQPVLDGAQQAVGVGEALGVGRVDVAGGGHLGQRGEGRRAAELGVEVAVHELQQLHRELDVADAARSPLELAPDQAPVG